MNVAQQAAAAGAVFAVREEPAGAALTGRHVAGVTGQEVARCATQPVTLALPILTTYTRQSVAAANPDDIHTTVSSCLS